MNKIIDGLYLGNIDAANDNMTLKRSGVTHILTVAMGIEPVNPFVCQKFNCYPFLTRNFYGKRSRSMTCQVLTYFHFLMKLLSNEDII